MYGYSVPCSILKNGSVVTATKSIVRCRKRIDHPPFGGGSHTFLPELGSQTPSNRAYWAFKRQKRHKPRATAGSGQALHTATVLPGNGTHQ